MKRLFFGAALLVSACGSFAVPDSESVPAKPTWNDPVQQILNDHCVQCHGEHPVRGAPQDFRLDSYAGTSDRAGARDMAGEIIEVVMEGEMPLEQPLGPNDTKILEKWFLDGTPEK